MPSFIDARCTKCGKKIGWCGEMKDMPKCPRCGHRPPDEELLADEKKMEDFENLLIARARAKANAERIKREAGKGKK